MHNPLKMITPTQLERRSVLKGVTLGAGAVVLQPFLNALAAEAPGEAPPKRFIFFMESNGLYPHHVQPKGVDPKSSGKLVDLPLADLELHEAIEPLTPFKNRLGLIQKLSHKISGGGDHGKGYGGLGCFQLAARDRRPNHRPRSRLGPTEHHSGARAGRATFRGRRVRQLRLGQCSPPADPHDLSTGPRLPDAVRQRGGRGREACVSGAEQAAGLVPLRHQARSQNELPAMDREKLDVYLDTFEQMRTRQDRINDNRDRLQANLPAIDKFESQRTTQRFEAQCAIATASLASGLTNVVTIDAAGGIGQYHTWKELGVTKDGHAIGHSADAPDSVKFAIAIRRFHAERVADLARRLDAVKEGNGTMLDNTLIVWMSDSGEGHHGFCGEWPLVLVGGLGDRLKTSGRFLQFPGYQEDAKETANRTIRNFYLSLLHAVGDKREQFGELDSKMPAAAQAGPLAEILA